MNRVRKGARFRVLNLAPHRTPRILGAVGCERGRSGAKGCEGGRRGAKGAKGCDGVRRGARFSSTPNKVPVLFRFQETIILFPFSTTEVVGHENTFCS